MPSAGSAAASRANALPPGVVTALRTGIGFERLSGYDGMAGGDQLRALGLYNWNSAISAAVFEDLSVLEVVLRNACHRQLEAWNAAQDHQHPWYHHPVLTPRHMQDVGVARGRVAQGKKTETQGRVVAELMLGFWRLLHSKECEVTLWRPCLRHAYPAASSLARQHVYDRLDHLNTLRNRIAHHEPVHGPTIGHVKSDLAGLHRELLELLGWLDPKIGSWVVANSRVPTLLAAKP